MNLTPLKKSFTKKINFRKTIDNPLIKLEIKTKFFKNNFTSKKVNKVIIKRRKYSNDDIKHFSIRYLKKKISQKKMNENEKKKKKIIYKNIKKYSENILDDYYIMIINNIISHNPNNIKSKFTEILNVIESKEILENYFYIKESYIKLVYLTKIIDKNTRFFPNYLKDSTIYLIMMKYLLEKEKLIIKTEKNKKKRDLKIQLKKCLQKNKKVFETTSKFIESFTESENINLEDNLQNLNNNSFSYNSKNSSINKVENLINDISIIINNFNKNKIKINKNIIKDSKKIKKNLKKLKSTKKENKNSKKLKEKKYRYIKSNTITKISSLNEKKKKSKLKLSNFYSPIQNLIKISFANNNIKEKIKNNYNQNNNLFLNENIEKRKNIRFKTLSSKNPITFPLYSYNNLYLKENENKFNTINNIKLIKKEEMKKGLKKYNFKPTNNFIYNFIQKADSQERIKQSIINFIEKYGKSKKKNNTKKKFKKYKNEDLDLSSENNYYIKSQKIVCPKYELYSKSNQKKYKVNKSRNALNNFLFENPNSVKETEYYYSEIFNNEKQFNFRKTEVQTSRINFNYKKFMKEKLNLIKNEFQLNKNKFYINSEKSNNKNKLRTKFIEPININKNKNNLEENNNINNKATIFTDRNRINIFNNIKTKFSLSLKDTIINYNNINIKKYNLSNKINNESKIKI